jgi:meiotically up-regulated gene 157 (Mug157) protein
VNMVAKSLVCGLWVAVVVAGGSAEERWQKEKYMDACPDYRHYSMYGHAPYSEGPLKLPFQRPAKQCRTFQSDTVEAIIADMNKNIMDKDLARIFENAFPNTLDTTVRWHVDGAKKTKSGSQVPFHIAGEEQWGGAQSFIVTGDINAEWLRDSTNQLAQYQPLAKKDKKIENLILGAVNTQAEFVLESPYCNAFQPPPPSGISPTGNGQGDNVHPGYEPSFVFECKYELDSLAAFLSLSNQFWTHSGSTAHLTARWYRALDTVLRVIDSQTLSTFDAYGTYMRNEYTFQRQTNTGTETLNLGGVGNPLNNGTGLIRSAFRPSDDATIFGFLIPANAMMAVELKRTAKMLEGVGNMKASKELASRGSKLEKAVWDHGVVTHPLHGKVFAYEVDGYGSQLVMDDANLPSLLSLPLMGFLDKNDEVYQNTRKMILSQLANPYYLTGDDFEGIGGPHIGLQNAWPMSLLVQAMSSDDDGEIMRALGSVKNVSLLGLVHESVYVGSRREYTREFIYSILLAILSSLVFEVWWMRRVLTLMQGVGSPGRIRFLRRLSWIWRGGNHICFLGRGRRRILLNDS